MSDACEDDDEVVGWEALFTVWPNCVTPDCENKQCTWSATKYCFLCAERLLGRDELIRRYNATHEYTWEQAKALEAAEEQAENLKEPI